MPRIVPDTGDAVVNFTATILACMAHPAQQFLPRIDRKDFWITCSPKSVPFLHSSRAETQKRPSNYGLALDSKNDKYPRKGKADRKCPGPPNPAFPVDWWHPSQEEIHLHLQPVALPSGHFLLKSQISP